MLRQRRAAQPDGFASQLEDDRLARVDIGQRTRDHVRMQVAVGDMPPDGDVEPARTEAGLVGRQQLLQPIERHHHVGGGFLDPRVDGLLRPADALVDGGRHGFPNRQQLVRPRVVTGHRHLDIVQDAGGVEEPAETPEGTVRCLGFARVPDVLVRAGARRVRRKFERDEQRHLRAGRNRDAVLAIDTIFAEQLETARVHVFDRRHIDAVRIVRPPRIASQAPHLADECHGAGAERERHEREAHRRPDRQEAKRRLGHDAQCAFAADEQVDEIHAGGREVSG